MITPHPFTAGLAEHKNQASDKKPGTFLPHGRLKIREHKMSKNRWLIGLFLAVLLILSACSTTPATSQAEDDFAVYAAAFRFEFKVESLDGLVITRLSHATANDQQDAYLKTEFAGAASPDLVADFLANNQTAQPLDAVFAQHSGIKLLSEDEIAKIFPSNSLWDGWKEFDARYPHTKGLITVSRIGYDRAHQYALVEVGSQAAPLAGVGEFLLLEKSDGAWQVIKNVMAWIS